MYSEQKLESTKHWIIHRGYHRKEVYQNDQVYGYSQTPTISHRAPLGKVKSQRGQYRFRLSENQSMVHNAQHTQRKGLYNQVYVPLLNNDAVVASKGVNAYHAAGQGMGMARTVPNEASINHFSDSGARLSTQ